VAHPDPDPSCGQDPHTSVGPSGQGWFARLFRPSPAAQAIINLLRADPDGWAVDDYVATHAATRVNIWVANADYGIALWVGNRNAFSERVKPPRNRDRKAIRKAIDHRCTAGWEKAARAALKALGNAEPALAEPLREAATTPAKPNGMNPNSNIEAKLAARTLEQP
jgi:hypothetical protein